MSSTTTTLASEFLIKISGDTHIHTHASKCQMTYDHMNAQVGDLTIRLQLAAGFLRTQFFLVLEKQKCTRATRCRGTLWLCGCFQLLLFSIILHLCVRHCKYTYAIFATSHRLYSICVYHFFPLLLLLAFFLRFCFFLRDSRCWGLLFVNFAWRNCLSYIIFLLVLKNVRKQAESSRVTQVYYLALSCRCELNILNANEDRAHPTDSGYEVITQRCSRRTRSLERARSKKHCVCVCVSSWWTSTPAKIEGLRKRSSKMNNIRTHTLPHMTAAEK